MAVIPPDAGVRMRMQTEGSLVQPLHGVRAIPSDLPDLQAGQAFTARILESLPDSTYRALVAGKQLTLQLPEGAAPGDTLELVVIDRTPKLLIAQRTETPAAGTAAGGPYPYAKISTAGRMIGQLMLPEGETPQSAPLNGGQPLLPQPPARAVDLVPMLAKAVSQSGLFYESHQAQWLAGQRPIEALRAEPQGQLAVPPAPQRSAAMQPGALPARQATAEAPNSLTYDSRAQPVVVAAADNLSTAAGAARTAATPEQGAPPTTVAPTIPDEIRPLVQQQLDAVATQRLAWHGEAWPGQRIDWEIEHDIAEEHGSGLPDEAATRWSTTLRLTMPRLGALNATLQLAGDSLRLRIATAADQPADDLRRQVQDLTQALASMGLGLQSFEVYREG